MKTIKEKLPEDRVTAFEKGAQAFAKKIVANLKDYEFVGSPNFFLAAGSNMSCSTLASP
jgi:Translationally controlled tumour protein